MNKSTKIIISFVFLGLIILLILIINCVKDSFENPKWHSLTQPINKEDVREDGKYIRTNSADSVFVGTFDTNDTGCKYLQINSKKPSIIVKNTKKPVIVKGSCLFFNTTDCANVNTATLSECSQWANKQIPIGTATGTVSSTSNGYKITLDPKTIPSNLYLCQNMQISSISGTSPVPPCSTPNNGSLNSKTILTGYPIGTVIFPLITNYSKYVEVPENDQDYDITVKTPKGIGRSYITIKANTKNINIPTGAKLFFKTCDSTITVGSVTNKLTKDNNTTYPLLYPPIPGINDNVFVIMIENFSVFYLPTQYEQNGPLQIYSTLNPTKLILKEQVCESTKNITKLPDQVVASGTLNFIVIGDWGFNQKHNCCARAGSRIVKGIADSMSKQKDITFVGTLGDNFYLGGIDGINDYQWNQTYENVFNPKVPWYAVVGNHDVYARDCGQSQIDYYLEKGGSQNWTMPNYYYSKLFKCNGFSLEIFMIDTNILNMVDAGDCSPANEQSGWAYHGEDSHGILQCGGTNSRNQVTIGKCNRFFECLWSNQVQWLEQSIATSNAEYKVVMAHIPPGGDCVGATLFGSRFNQIKTLFTKYGVHYFFGGHFHSSSCGYNSDTNLNIIMTGAGGGSGGGGGSAECVNNWGDKQKLWGKYGYPASSGGKGPGPDSGIFAYTLMNVTEKSFIISFISNENKVLWTDDISNNIKN